jgi:predicted HTH transcriptional regulator
MSTPPSLEEIVNVALSLLGDMPSWQVAWPPSLGIRITRHDEEPPEEVQQLLLDMARTEEGGLLAILVPKGPFRINIVSADRVLECVERWVGANAPGIIVDSKAAPCAEGEVALLVIREAEPGVMPGPGEIDAIEDATREHLDMAAVRSATRFVLVQEPTWGWPDRAERDEAAMLAARILKKNGMEPCPTLAGLVVFGVQPSRLLRGARVILRSRREVVVRGSLAEMATDTARHPLVCDGIEAAVIRELVLNAFVHRDWSPEARDVPVLVARTPGRLEVVSPGVFNGGSAPTNPVLRGLARMRGLIHAEGAGLARVEKALGRIRASLRIAESGGEVRTIVELPELVDARFVQQPAAQMVVAPRQVPNRGLPQPRAPSAVVVEAPVAVNETPVEVEEPVAVPTQREAAIVDLLARQGEMNTRAITESLGWSRSTVRDTLARLVQEGRIQRLAASPRSPEQSYAVVGA